MSVLVLAGVHRSFGINTLLADIHLDVSDGQRIALLGDNGSGKTTLLRLAAGLLQPTQGTVMRNGHPTTSPQGRKAVSWVGQDAAVYAHLTVREHLKWWGDTHGRSVDVERWLEECGLVNEGSEMATSLSRGQRQRLRLAMAFSVDPDLLLLDEPTTALDAAGRGWLLRQLSQSTAAMIIATHEATLIDHLDADRYTLSGGTLVCE